MQGLVLDKRGVASPRPLPPGYVWINGRNNGANVILRSERNVPAPTSTPASDSDEEIVEVEPDSGEEVEVEKEPEKVEVEKEPEEVEVKNDDTANCPPGMTRVFVRYPCGKGQYYYYLGKPKRGKRFRSATSAWRYHGAVSGEGGSGGG